MVKYLLEIDDIVNTSSFLIYFKRTIVQGGGGGL